MEKLTRILAVAERLDDSAALLEKAVTLARCFAARVDVLACGATQMRALATLCVTRGYDEVRLTSVYRGEESLESMILRHVHTSRPDLLIKTPAPQERDGEALAESDWLLGGNCPVPVLIVWPQPWATPARFAVAVDVADAAGVRSSRASLHAAGFLALGCRGNLDIFYSERELVDEGVRSARAAEVTHLVHEFRVGCERLHVHSGAPQVRLPPLLAIGNYDVFVIGLDGESDGSSDAGEALAQRLAAAANGDLLLVRGAVDLEARMAEWRRPSRGEQPAY